MRKILTLGVIFAAVWVVGGCSGSDLPPPNAPGAEANTKKAFTTEEAAAAKPKRNASGGE